MKYNWLMFAFKDHPYNVTCSFFSHVFQQVPCLIYSSFRLNVSEIVRIRLRFIIFHVNFSYSHIICWQDYPLLIEFSWHFYQKKSFGHISVSLFLDSFSVLLIYIPSFKQYQWQQCNISQSHMVVFSHFILFLSLFLLKITGILDSLLFHINFIF